MRPILRWLLIGLVVAGALTLIAVGSAYLPKGSGPKYLSASVSRGKVETVINSTGTIKAVRSVTVGSFASGPLKKIYVKFNDYVKKEEFRPECAAGMVGLGAMGDNASVVRSAGLYEAFHITYPATKLADIDPKILRANRDRDAATMDRERATLNTMIAKREEVRNQLEQAQRRKKRGDSLYDNWTIDKKTGTKVNRNFISTDEMDTYKYAVLVAAAQFESAEAAVHQGQASIRSAEAALKYSQDQLDYAEIFSPETGYVIEKKVDEGQTVNAQFQTPELFVIAAELDRHVDVHASVDEADIGQIRIAQQRGRPVTFTVDAYQGELFKGVIQEVRMSSTTVQNVVTYPVVIRADNPRIPGNFTGPNMKLMPGLTANITFHIEAKEDVLRVPTAALRFVPTAAQVRAEDRHLVDTTASSTSSPKRSAEESARAARERTKRHVWVIGEHNLLRAIPVTLGLVDRQFAEVTSGDLSAGQVVVTGFEVER